MPARLKAKQTSKQLPCPYCGEVKCNCMKLAGAFYIVMALTLASFALGMLSLVTTVWVVAVLVALKGVMYLSRSR